MDGRQGKATAVVAPVRSSTKSASSAQVSLAIYVSQHCPICAHAYDVAVLIRRDFPAVVVQLVDIHDAQEIIPGFVFATPTYLLNGRVWSLGNPSPEKVEETFRNLSEAALGSLVCCEE